MQGQPTHVLASEQARNCRSSNLEAGPHFRPSPHVGIVRVSGAGPGVGASLSRSGPGLLGGVRLFNRSRRPTEFSGLEARTPYCTFPVNRKSQ